MNLATLLSGRRLIHSAPSLLNSCGVVLSPPPPYDSPVASALRVCRRCSGTTAPPKTAVAPAPSDVRLTGHAGGATQGLPGDPSVYAPVSHSPSGVDGLLKTQETLYHDRCRHGNGAG